ncbi:MAG: S41 family peptidase [Micavibrio sp.]
MTSKKIKGFLAAAFLGAACMGTAANADEFPANHPLKSPEAQAEYIQVLRQVIGQMHIDGVKTVDDEKMLSAAINGMLKELDPHSSYMTKKEYEEFKAESSGEFFGVGLEMGVDENDAVKVISPVKDGPAERAGIQANDVVTHVDGQPTQGLPLNEVTKKIRGEKGVAVKLTISRNGGAGFDVSIVRDVIKSEAVTSRMIGNDIGYIQISSFANDNVDEDFRAAIQNLQKNNNVKGFVIDLRYNPGGYVHKVNQIIDDVLDSNGVMVSMRGRDPANNEVHRATPGDLTGGKPIVLMVNKGSASASELMAGALQDHKRATILGTQSYGKGSVQVVLPGPVGDALKITISRYYTPDGRSIQNRGITPDILYVAPVDPDAPKFKTEAEQENTLANDQDPNIVPIKTTSTCAPNPADAAAVVDKSLQDRRGKTDFELICAVNTLRGTNALTVTAPYVDPAAKKAAPAPRP